MRTLYFCRHAKSSWADPGQADFDRPLNERGERNAAYMADLFKERGEPVDLLVVLAAIAFVVIFVVHDDDDAAVRDDGHDVAPRRQRHRRLQPVLDL